MAMVLQRYNVLITGGAGVGKSHVTQRLVQRLRDLHINVSGAARTLAVCACCKAMKTHP